MRPWAGSAPGGRRSKSGAPGARTGSAVDVVLQLLDDELLLVELDDDTTAFEIFSSQGETFTRHALLVCVTKQNDANRPIISDNTVTGCVDILGTLAKKHKR